MPHGCATRDGNFSTSNSGRRAWLVKPPRSVKLPAMNLTRRRTLAIRYAFAIGMIAGAGCIERTVTIRTEPEHALVYLNDDEVGRSPVTVPFTWYGDYDIVIRKEGYETIKTHHRINTPWYQLPGIDLITESLLPFTIRDRRVLPVYTLAPQTLPEKEDVISRAEAMREKALFTK